MKNQHFKLTPIAAAIALHTSALATASVTIPDGTTANTTSQTPGETITVAQGSSVVVNGDSAVTIDDPNVTLDNDGSINSDMTAVDVVSGGDNATINNGPNNPDALISGAVNGVRFADDVDGGTVVNNGTISSASRAIDIQGDNITVTNNSGGSIEGLGDQRNGTIYTNDTANNLLLITMVLSTPVKVIPVPLFQYHWTLTPRPPVALPIVAPCRDAARQLLAPLLLVMVSGWRLYVRLEH